LCDFISKDVIHHRLEGCWRVREAKKHNGRLKESFAGFESGLPLITFLDLNVIIPPLYIELGEQVVPSQVIDKIVNEGEGVSIQYCPFV
jgi:hypothetical protein